MVFSIKSPIEKKQKKIGVQEAFNIWHLLATKYSSLERLQIWDNYIHDLDLKIITRKYLVEVESNIHILEEKMKQYSIKGMDTPRKSVRTSANSEIVTDELIGGWLLLLSQEHINLLLGVIRTSTTNDHLRSLFINIAQDAINRLDKLIKYLKLKGWLVNPPLYTNTPFEAQEKIDVGEAFHLWDHLTFRYDNIEQTQLYYTLAHDGDFKILLKTGLENSLRKQASKLEKELDYFGIPLPKRPPNITVNMADTEIVDDDYLFRMLATGIQGAVMMHTKALNQSLTNDRIRKLFKQLLLSEISIGNKLIKFGKMKGWLHPAPRYQL